MDMVEFNKIKLAYGSHHAFEEGVCAMELVAHLAGEPHSDSPKCTCTCPVIADFIRTWNDSLSAEDRERLLKPLIPRLIGTRSSKRVEMQRSMLAQDWLIRVYTPEWLSLREDLRKHAKTLRDLPPILTIEDLAKAQPNLSAAWSAAEATTEAAAWFALKPTELKLQESALDLLERMLALRDEV